MGKNSRMKRDNPNRNKAFKKLRTLPDSGQEVITLKNGAEMVINPMKRFLLGKPYTHPELQNHVIRKIGKYALGDEKYNELEKQASQVSAPVEIETN